MWLLTSHIPSWLSLGFLFLNKSETNPNAVQGTSLRQPMYLKSFVAKDEYASGPGLTLGCKKALHPLNHPMESY